MQVWQVGLIMQHKGKTNRFYLRRLDIIYYAQSYHRTNNCGLAGANDSLSQHTVIYISVIYHAWRGSANVVWLVFYVYTPQNMGISPPHISLYGPPHRCCPKRRRSGPYHSSPGWEAGTQRYISLTCSHLEAIYSLNQLNCFILKSWITWRDQAWTLQKPLIQKPEASLLPARWQPDHQWVSSCSSSPPNEGYTSILSLLHI